MLLILIEIISIFLTYKSGSNKFVNEKIKRDGPVYAIMLKDKNSDKYYSYTEQKWPEIGYKYIEELSNCIDDEGNTIEGIMSFDNDNRIATIKSKKEAYCYLYFEYDPAPTNFEFKITAMKEERSKKYTNKTTNSATLSWLDDDVKSYCIFEEKVERGIKASTNVMDYCKWTPISEEERKNGKATVNFTLKTETNEERILSAYIKDEAGSVIGGTDKGIDKITFDNKGPIINYVYTNVKRLDPVWYQKLSILLTSVDEGIGVDNINYCLDTSACEPNIPGSNGSVNIDMKTTDNKGQMITAKATDKLGNVTSGWKSSIYKVDEVSPKLKIEVGTKRQAEGVTDWYQMLYLTTTIEDEGSGIKEILYCIDTNANDDVECSPTNRQYANTGALSQNVNFQIQNGKNPQKLIVKVKDASGREATEVSDLYQVDGIPPTCQSINKTSVLGTTKGIDGNVTCYDTLSGCERYSYPFYDLKNPNNVINIRDKAGNTFPCNVQITSRNQKCSKPCTGHSRYACGTECSGGYTGAYICGNSQHGAYYCGRPSGAGECSYAGDCCAGGYVTKYCEGDCNSWGSCSATAWFDDNNCVPGKKVDCRTLYY